MAWSLFEVFAELNSDATILNFPAKAPKAFTLSAAVGPVTIPKTVITGSRLFPS